MTIIKKKPRANAWTPKEEEQFTQYLNKNKNLNFKEMKDYFVVLEEKEQIKNISKRTEKALMFHFLEILKKDYKVPIESKKIICEKYGIAENDFVNYITTMTNMINNQNNKVVDIPINKITLTKKDIIDNTINIKVNDNKDNYDKKNNYDNKDNNNDNNDKKETDGKAGEKVIYKKTVVTETEGNSNSDQKIKKMKKQIKKLKKDQTIMKMLLLENRILELEKKVNKLIN